MTATHPTPGGDPAAKRLAKAAKRVQNSRGRKKSPLPAAKHSLSNLDGPPEEPIKGVALAAPDDYTVEALYENGVPDFGPLPDGAIRSVRTPRNKGKIKGLAECVDLMQLAASYLTEQAKYWPELRKAGLIASPDDTFAVAAMIELLKLRHVSGEVQVPPLELLRTVKKLATAYCRYSNDKSKPTSIVDQLSRILRKAKEQDRFVPWEWVFADYAVTGLDSGRSGYVAAKALMADAAAGCDLMYIDDFTRASRDEIEWWRLAAMIKRLKKNLIAAGEHFDLSDSMSDTMISVYGMLSRLFLKGLREKVRRGMAGAARRGTVTGRVAFGYCRVPVQDAGGNICMAPDGQQLMTLAIDPEQATWVNRVFGWYVDDCLSTEVICQRLNDNRVGGNSTWTPSSVIKLIRQTKYKGVFIYGMTRNEVDEDQKPVVVEVERSEWIIKRCRNLAIVPYELWKRANKRYWALNKTCPRTGKKFSRNERHATTLLSGTIFCETCGRELMLSHSDERYRSFSCLNGSVGGYGCTFSSHKSAAIVENAILGCLNQLLGDDAIDEVLADANAELAKLQSETPDDGRPLRSQIKVLQQKQARCIKRVSETDEVSLVKDLEKAAADYGRQINDLKQQLTSIETQEKLVAAKPLTAEDVRAHLTDVRSLLTRVTDPVVVPRAAEAIRAITGPIKISHRPRPGSTRMEWVAHFTPNTAAVLPPGTPCDGVEIPEQVVVLDKPPKAVQVAPKVKALLDQAEAASGEKPSVLKISQALNIAYYLATDALAYLESGRLPRKRINKRQSKGRKPKGEMRRDPLYIRHAAQVKDLAERGNLSHVAIAERLGINVCTVQRAYAYASREAIEQKVNAGKKFMRPAPRKLSAAHEKQIVALKVEGKRAVDIAEMFGVSYGTIYNVVKRNMIG